MLYPNGFDLERTKSWLVTTATFEGKTIAGLQYVLCDDGFLSDLNQRYLGHSTLTDIITFPYAYHPIEAEIYISLDRVRENAKTYASNNLLSELRRVVMHGLLHMCGYQDGTKEQIKVMRNLESKYLQQF